MPNHAPLHDTTPNPSPPGVIAALAIPMLMAALDTSIANVTLPTLAHAFGASFARVQWVVLAYLLTLTTLIVGAGKLGDRFGRRRVLLLGVGFFTVASAACGLASGLGVLIAARAAQGLGASVMMALSLAFVGDAVPVSGTGRAMGLLGTMSAIGTALGPALGGMLIATVGWRAVFLVNVPIGLVSLWLAAARLPADRTSSAASARSFDVPGSLALAATLAAYSLAMTSARTGGSPAAFLLLGAAGIGAALFARIESHMAQPLVRLRMLRDGVLGPGLLMSTLVSTVMMSTLVVGPFYLARALALDATRVGLAMSAGPLVVVLAGVPAGRAVDRLGSRPTTLAGLIGIAAGALLLALLPATSGLTGYLLPIVLLTAGYALFQTANNTAVMTGLVADRGVVSGLLNLSRNIGLVTGASFMGTVFATVSGTSNAPSARPEAIALGMRATFGVAAALMTLAILLANRASAPSRALATAGRR